MKLEVYTKTLTALKDTLIIAVIALLGWRYFPLLIDPAQTSNFEIAEINLLVVKLKPEGSERAIPASAVPGAAQNSDLAEADAPSEGGEEDQNTPVPEQPQGEVAYYTQQRGGELTRKQVAIPAQNIVTQGSIDAKQSVMGWSYLGTYRDGQYIDLIFEFDNSVAPEDLLGKTLKANTDVFIRDDYPKFVLGWTKGDRMGVISSGTNIKVTDVKLIPAKGGGSRVWVKS